MMNFFPHFKASFPGSEYLFSPSFTFAAKILLFYVLFYAVLAGFFAAMLAVFYQTLDENKPKWQLENGLIGNNPGN